MTGAPPRAIAKVTLRAQGRSRDICPARTAPALRSVRAVQPWDGIFPLPALEQHRAAVYQRCVRIQSPGLSASPPVIARLRGA